MRIPILIAAMIATIAAPAFADALTLEDVRAMSDDELYSLADTLSSEDEVRLHDEARGEFPDGALGLQSVLNKLQKSNDELEACNQAIESGTTSSVRALSQLEPGTYFSLLRIASIPTDEVHDMTVAERKNESKRATRENNQILRDFRDCKRKYRKRFGID